MKRFALLLCALSITIPALSQTRTASPGVSDADMKNFVAIDPIDIHTHILRNDPAFSAMLQSLHLHLLNVLVIDPKDDPAHPLFPAHQPAAWQFNSSNSSRVSLSTNFNPF